MAKPMDKGKDFFEKEVDMRKGRIVFMTVFIMAILLIAVSAPAAKKDTLVVAFNDVVATLDHYQSTMRTTIQLGYMVWDSLVTRNPDTGEIIPGLARSWKMIDPLTWEFKLQPGVKFHNGNPCNAEAVRYTIEERVLDEKQKSPQAVNFKWIKKVEVVDDVTFRIITYQPYPIVLERLNTLFVYDPVYGKQAGDQKVAEAPMGSGPYAFVKWDRGSQIVLKKNPNYWVKGIPKIDNVILRTIPEISTRVAELISGNVDFGLNYTPDVWELLQKSPNVAPLEVPILRINFWQFDGSGVASKGPWTDKRVRQAIIHAVDRKAIIQKVMGGHAGELHGPCNPLQWGYDPAVKQYDYPYNPEKAKALLKQAGYEKGFTVDLWFYEGIQKQPNLAAMGYLEQLGIKVNIKDYAGNIGQLIRLRNTRKVTGIGNFTWGSYNIFDADAAMPAWFLTKEGMCYNLDQELNDWLQEARDSVDPAKRKALYSKAQRKIMQEAYWMPFFVVHQIYGRNKDLEIVVGKDEVPRFNEAHWK
jgi:peptide/nickel transport system substrate-binding protein